MTTKGTLFLCGAGNAEGVRLALRVNQAEHRWTNVVLLDDDPTKLGRTLIGVEIVGPLAHLARADPARDEVVNLVARTTAKRAMVRERIVASGIPCASLIEPDIDLLGVETDGDIMAYQHAVLGPDIVIGAGSVIFMGAVVGHECRVGPGCVVAANAVLNARVALGAGVYVGSNATVLPEVVVGEWATIGAGSVVIQDVPAGATVLGVPAQIIREGTAVTARTAPGGPASPAPGTGATIPVSVAELERAVTAIWADVLHVASVGPRENFFDLGGCSLLALRARDRLERAINRTLEPTDMFRFPTVRTLAAFLAETNGGIQSVPAWSNEATQRATARRQARGRGQAALHRAG
ncbi:MAG TPA: phosphopantetheine-binding protein [Gemmatimonadales bacterium]